MTFAEDIKNCLRVLRQGGVILYPTDTVWGLGCDPSSRDAVEKIFSIKERHESKSLILLADSVSMVQRYVKEIPDAAFQIIDVTDKPLTIVYPGAKNLAEGIASDDGSVGIRITSDDFCARLIGDFCKPVVSTSANRSGELTPSCFDEIPADIIRSVDYAVSYRRNDQHRHKPSPVIKIGLNGVISILRK
jgi:L-threonylcarbamoyladenylate synthase